MKRNPILACFLALCFSQASATTIPPATGTALDGHAVMLPRDLPAGATILILGFSKRSAIATISWTEPVRNSLASMPSVGYYDLPFLEDAPSFVRPMILRSMRQQIPDVIKPNFVPVVTGEAAWKHLTSFSEDAPDAAYVVLVDRSGNVRWQTHDPFNPTRFAELTAAARNVSAESH